MAESEPKKVATELDNLPSELRAAFERTGSGCIAVETNIGVVHVCHAADRDIEGSCQ